MPKNPHADFTPALEGYSGQGKFRFWCQMALPLTYDDSLSYYELLCKVVNYLNHTIEDVANAETNVSRLAEAYTQLQNYVNNYFDDLDIEAELRNVLDAMAEDGTLDDLLDPLVQDHLPSVVDDQIDDVVADQIGDAVAGQIDDVVAEQLPPLVDEGIPGKVSDWLTENVDPVGSAVVVDSSLTISGAAADAKVTGDELANLKTQINTIADFYTPTNYGEISASDAVVPTAAAQNVTITDNVAGGIDLSNATATNVAIGFPLDDLAYTGNKAYNIKVKTADAVTPISFGLYSGKTVESGGTIRYTLTANEEDPTIYEYNNLTMANYNYESYGKLFLVYSLRYNQTTAANIQLEITEVGDIAKTIIRNNVLENIGEDNLSSDVLQTLEQVSTNESDIANINDTLDDVIENHVPVNYGEISASDAIVPSSMSGNVTVSDNASGGIDITNGSGVNGNIAFLLDDLAYTDNSKKYDVKVKLAGGVTPIAFGLYSGVSTSSSGIVRYTLTANPDDPTTYEYKNLSIANYNYASYGKLFFAYNLRYNQTTAANIQLEIVESGDTAKTLIKNTAIENIGEDNLTDTLKEQIDIVSGSKPTLYGGKEITTFNKGVAIGDSLTAGVFNYNEGGSNGYETYTSFSFPAKLKQLSSVDMVNVSNGGYTSAEWWAAHENDDLSGYQFAIIQLGVNDAIELSGWTQTSETAFTNIINKLKTENNGIFIFVSTIIPASSYSGATYDEVSDGIRDLVESLNDNHVILLDMALYGNTKNAIGYNNGHLSALGYNRLAQDYYSYISYVISKNMTLFRNIQFIGTTHSYN